MNIPLIKNLVQTHSLEKLEKVEKELVEGDLPSIDLEGDPDSYLVASDEPDYHDEKNAIRDGGEDLTHIMAAVWIKRQMEEKDIPLKEALRLYTQRIRNTIS